MVLDAALVYPSIAAAGMGQVKVSARAGTPRYVAEGCESFSNHLSTAADDDQTLQLLAHFVQCQPSEEEEDEAALVLSQHLNTGYAQHNPTAVSCTAQKTVQSPCQDAASHGLDQKGRAVGRLVPQHGVVRLVGPRPIAEGRESIAAFHPSWHLRAAHQVPHEDPSEHPSSDDPEGDLLGGFWRPAVAAESIAAQRQPSIAAKAGCSNFSSHVVSMQQQAIKQQSASSKQSQQRSAIDDAVLSSEDSEGEIGEDVGYADYESEAGESLQETDRQHLDSLQSSGPALIGTVREGRIGEHLDDPDIRYSLCIYDM